MASGLSDEQIAQLRDEVAAGKSPRVRISGAQFRSGVVRKVGAPATDGTDYVTVRVRVDGVTDDLRFAPRELSRGKEAPAKRPARKSPVTRSARKSPAKRPAPKSPPPDRPDSTAAGRREATPAPPNTPDPPRRARPAATGRRATPPSDELGSAAGPPAAATAARKRSGRKATSAASVTITLQSAGTSWTVNAQRGARSVARNLTVNPGVVSAVAGLLQVASLEEAVAAVNDTARIEAEARAEELRAELARIQAVLDSHRRP